MRKQVYLAIIDCLRKANIGVQHISLWNENIVTTEQVNDCNLPAVFIEFSSLQWKQQMQGVKSATAHVNLHIVTNASADPSGILQTFDTIDQIVATIQGLSGEGFNRFQHIETIPDHDYEGIQHNIEIFATEIINTGAVRKKEVVTLQKVVIH